MIKYIITDFDGTLVDTKEANKKAYEQVFREASYKFDTATYDTLFGLRIDDLCNKMNIDPKDRAFIKRRKAEVYPSYFCTIRLNHALLNLLRLAKKNDIKVALASTASRKNIVNVLEYFGLKDLFDSIVAGEDVVTGKPSGDVYKAAMTVVGAEDPGEVLVFEDTEIGVVAAHNAGINNITKFYIWNS
jgi:beta-phosphoglucomutase